MATRANAFAEFTQSASASSPFFGWIGSIWPIRATPGASKVNRNAIKHGRYTAEAIARPSRDRKADPHRSAVWLAAHRINSG